MKRLFSELLCRLITVSVLLLVFLVLSYFSVRCQFRIASFSHARIGVSCKRGAP